MYRFNRGVIVSVIFSTISSFHALEAGMSTTAETKRGEEADGYESEGYKTIPEIHEYDSDWFLHWMQHGHVFNYSMPPNKKPHCLTCVKGVGVSMPCCGAPVCLDCIGKTRMWDEDEDSDDGECLPNVWCPHCEVDPGPILWAKNRGEFRGEQFDWYTPPPRTPTTDLGWRLLCKKSPLEWTVPLKSKRSINSPPWVKPKRVKYSHDPLPPVPLIMRPRDKSKLVVLPNFRFP